MGAPEERTTEQLQEIVECWLLQHGELSTVARRQKARYIDSKLKKADRSEQNLPWMVTLALSNASTPNGGKLGKLVGATALGFEIRDVPHHIKRKMQGHIHQALA
jgi:hypothetical protein